MNRVLKGTEFSVRNTQVRGGYVVLVGEVEGSIAVGDELLQNIDEVAELFLFLSSLCVILPPPLI